MGGNCSEEKTFGLRGIEADASRLGGYRRLWVGIRAQTGLQMNYL